MGELQTIWLQIEIPIHIATPFFFVFIGIEVVLLRVACHHEARKSYSSIDTRTSITMGIGALVFFAVFKLATMVLFVFLWTYVARGSSRRIRGGVGWCRGPPQAETETASAESTVVAV